MVAVPANIPATTPVNGLTLAMVLALLLQVPPVVTSVRFVLKPTHIDGVPFIVAGAPVTGTTNIASAGQPVV